MLLGVTAIWLRTFFFDKTQETIVRKTKDIAPIPPPKDDEVWLKKLRNNNFKTSLLADEYHLSWDLVDPIFGNIRLYNLEYKKLDEFEYSCVTQVLKGKIWFETKKNGSSYDVFAQTKDKIMAQKLFKTIKDYYIEGQYREILKQKDNIYDKK